jgi:hypothetical protein
MSQKYFPIKVEPACPLKWNWSTLYLNQAVSACCHRTGFNPLTVENFDNFHNNPKVLAERTQMLNGRWPEESCAYCRGIESNGGFSDRMWHSKVPDQVPVELEQDPNAIVVTPSTVEVFFNSSCNMSCLYCPPGVSSKVNEEFTKFGVFKKNGVELIPHQRSSESKELVEKMFSWMTENLGKIRRFHILGGEPLYQSEFFRTLDILEANPCPDLEFEIISNLKHNHSKFKSVIERLKSMAAKRCFKRIDILCSIDGWGEPQEYIRWGLDLNQWQENFEYLLENKWIRTSVNLTLSNLIIKTVPVLLEKLARWRKTNKIPMTISGVTPAPSWLMLNVFGPELFAEDFKHILDLLPTTTEDEKINFQYIQGLQKFSNEPRKENEIIKLHTFLEEKDRRRGTDWKKVFPWLIPEFEKCGIVV